MRSVYRTGRRLSELLLQPSRRRRSLALAGRGVPQSLLFVCHGNICRSPYAANAVQALLPEDLRRRVQVESAGFVGPDRPVPPEAVAVARARGVDLSLHRSKLVTPELVAKADLVFVMDAAQREQLLREVSRPRGPVLVLGECDPDWRGSRAIPDPHGMPPSTFDHTFDRLDRCLRAVADAITAASSG